MNIAPLFQSPTHPVVITPAADAGVDAGVDALRSYVDANRDPLRKLLLEHGGILFRGFGIDGAEAFGDCVAGFGAQAFDYVGGNSPRTRVARDVFTSTEYPASETISLHNEMSYLPAWPRRLFFYAQTPALTGGQTSLASSVDLLRALPDRIVQAYQQKGLNYIRTFPSGIKLGKSWQVTYASEDRDEVEALIRAQGSTCAWAPNGTLKVGTRCEALMRHPETGAEAWFNQAEQWHPSALHPDLRALFESRNMLVHNCEHGDGSPLDESMLATIRQRAADNKLLFDWKKGDMLMIDNILMMHGRESFTGNRKTLAYLSGT